MYSKILLKVVQIFLFQLLILMGSVNSDRKQKISDVNVLLPVCSNKPCGSVSYKITAFAGCYEWSIDKPSSLVLFQIPDLESDSSCFSSVIISTITDDISTKDSLWLIAKDKKSNEEFKCKVGFASVKTLTIGKRFDHMNVGEIVELTAIGYDEFNNMFSSLEGFKFNWKMNSYKSNVPAAQILKLKEEKREASEVRLKIEENFFSDIILLRGIKTGRIDITAELKENGYEKIEFKVINLYVVERFKIIPDEIYLHIGIDYKFKIKYLINESKAVDPLNYSWSLPNKSCGEVKNNGTYLSEIQCETVITANDKRIDNFNQAKSKIHNVIPGKMDLGIHEIDNFERSSYKLSNYDKASNNFSFLSQWELVVDKYYVIKNFLFFETHPINDENDKIKYNIGNGDYKKYFEEIECNKEKKFCIVRAKLIKEENFEINAEMEDKKFPVKKFVKIYSKVEINKYGKTKFILPYLGYISQSEDSSFESQELKLSVKGGTSRYIYYSTNTNIVNIKNEIIYGQHLGSTVVKVVDSRIFTNFDYVYVDVEEISDLKYIEERQEIEKNNDFQIMISAVNSQGEIFTNCTSLSVYQQSDFTSDEIISVSNDENTIGINKFINKNPELMMKRYPNEKNQDYLKYSNYGICSMKRFKTNIEGLRQLKFYTKLKSLSRDSSIQDLRNYSSKYSQVLIYDKLFIQSPSFVDLFTKKLLGKGLDKQIQNTFVLTKDTEINFKFVGGVSRWIDDSMDYNEIVQYREINNTSPVDKFNFLNNKLQNIKSNQDKNLIFKCKENDVKNDIQVKYTLKNKESLSLLRPKTTEFTFTIVCTVPHSLSIFLLDDSININDLLPDNRQIDIFSLEQKRNIEYYIKKEATERFRVYAFDDKKRLFFNITNLKGSWELEYEKQNLSENQINNMKHLLVGKSNIYNSPEFVHRKIKFSDFRAKFNLNYKMGPISQQITIFLIDLPIIEPNNSSLFLIENNFLTLKLKHGSGDFDLTYSDNQIANADYMKNEKQIKIYPRRKGILQISVKDRKMIQVVTTGNVFISKINKIQLIGAGLVQVETEKKLLLKVYDDYGNIFSSDQIPKMKLVIESSKKKGIEFNLTNGIISSNEIIARGMISDDYYIKVVDPSTKMASNTIKLIVFDKLEIFPPYLLLLPGATYMLNIRGGPRDFISIVRKYKIAENTIATVKDSEPEVTAVNLGETTLKITLELKKDEDNQENSILCTEEIKVHVAIPDGLDIWNAYNRKIYIKSNIRLLAMLKLGTKIFSLGNSNIDYYWNIDPPTNGQLATTSPIINQDCFQTKNESCDSKDVSIANNVGIFLTALNKGDIDVKLKLYIHYPEAFKKYTSDFEKKEKMIIEGKLDIDIPRFNDEKSHSTLYLVPQNVIHELKTNKDPNFSRFSLIQEKEQVLELSESGRIKTFDKVGLAQILVERREKEDLPFTPIVLPVYVTNYFSIFVQKSYTLLDMEIGQNYKLKVQIQHEYGMIFAEKFENLSLRVVESNPSIVKTELTDQNSVLSISAQNKGETNIILYCPKSKKIYDIIKVSVFTSFQFPEKIKINIGGTIDFLSKNPNKRNYLMYDADWHVEDPSILRFDPTLGNFKAIGEGKTRVNLLSKDKTKAKLSTLIHVGRIKKINVIAGPNIITPIKTHPNYQTEYRIVFKSLIDDNEEVSSSDENNTIDQRLNVKCLTNNPNIFTTQLESSRINGRVIPDEKDCIVKLRELQYDIKVPKNIEVEIVTESQGERPQDRYSLKTRHLFPYVEPFRILNNVKEINFSRNNRTFILEFSSLNDIEINTDEPKYIKFVKDGENKIKVNIPYDISDGFKNIPLSFYNKLSSQREDIFVSYDHMEDDRTKTTVLGIYRSTIVDLLSLLVLIAVIVVLFKAFLENRPQDNNFQQNPGYPMDYTSAGKPRGSSLKSLNLTHQ